MIKILHFITDTNVGGAGVLLCKQISGIDKRKFDIAVALPHKSQLIEMLKDLPCKIIKLKHGADRSFSLDALIESYKIIKEEHPDIVHSHASLSSRISATVLNVPSRVFTKHCAPPLKKSAKIPLKKCLVCKANKFLSTSVIATAECAKISLIEVGCDERKIKTIINGASPQRILSDNEKAFYREKFGLNESDFVISIIARLDKGKGHETLLRCAKICAKTHPNFRFLIVGSGNFEKELKALSQTLGVCDKVHFLGFQNDVAPIFNLTDVNVNCSYISETSSLSLSEGMSLGIPCVVSDIGGNPYMVKNGENGLVFPANDEIALAKAIIRLYTDKKLYKKCSVGAIKRYNEELNDKTMCRKMTSFYLREYRKH